MGDARAVTVVQAAEVSVVSSGVLADIRAAEAANTRRAHISDWACFESWCRDRGASACPATPETVAEYISTLSTTHRPSTLQRRLASISVAHRAKGFATPTSSVLVRKVLKGIRNRVGVAKSKKAPLRVEHLRRMPEALPETRKGLRDKALLLVGFCGAFRRSELVSIDVEDVVFVPQGMTIRLRRSKTDQEGHGRVLDIAYGSRKDMCPVTALRDWLTTSGITEGPVFRGVDRHGRISSGRLSDRAVADVVQAVAAFLGFDPSTFGGHSLRAGFVTDALKAGVPAPVIQQVTGHRSEAMLGEYLREAQLFSYNLTSKLGL